MIHHASNHPVLIKKITLSVWTLRDEIEAIIAKRMHEITPVQTQPDSPVTGPLDHQDLIEEYRPGGNHQNLLQFPQNNNANVTQEAPKVDAAAETPNADAAAEAPNADSAAETPEGSSEEVKAQTAGENPFAEVLEGGEGTPTAEAPVAKAENVTFVEHASNEEEVVVLQRRPSLAPHCIYHGKTLLAEIFMDRIHFFSTQSFIEGMSIVIQFNIPQSFVINADVIYSRRYGNKSRIISDKKMPYRVAAKFTFLRPGERTLLRRLLQSIEPNIKAEAKVETDATSTTKAESNDLGLGDLDNLDL